MALNGSREDLDFRNFKENPSDLGVDRRVVIKNTSPIPVILSDDTTSGNELFLIAATVSTPNVDQTLISHTVGVGLSLDIQSAIVKYAHYSKFFIKLNGSIIGSGRTGPAKGQDSFEWDRVRYHAVAGDLIELVFRAYVDTPIDDVEAYIIGVEQ